MNKAGGCTADCPTTSTQCGITPGCADDGNCKALGTAVITCKDNKFYGAKCDNTCDNG
ncbi:MAG: hypothetical protein QF535_07050 [Anaerolineales bacterium]|jgi:hypothetical protein|nr:hypothetical protein [Anaerolineales bacterium]